MPAEEERSWPATGVPVTVGGAVTAGRAAVAPPAATATVGGDAAVAVPPNACAVTASTSACPTSSATGRYVSAVAPTIGAHVPPAASQRCHW